MSFCRYTAGNGQPVVWIQAAIKLTTRYDTTNTTEPDDQSRSQRSLGSSTDVVLRVCDDGGHVTLRTGDGEERSKVPGAEFTGVRQNHQTDDTDDVTGNDERSTESDLVAENGGGKGVDGGEDVRRGTEDKGESSAETTTGKDDGQEEGDWIVSSVS